MREVSTLSRRLLLLPLPILTPGPYIDPPAAGEGPSSSSQAARRAKRPPRMLPRIGLRSRTEDEEVNGYERIPSPADYTIIQDATDNSSAPDSNSAKVGVWGVGGGLRGDKVMTRPRWLIHDITDSSSAPNSTRQRWGVGVGRAGGGRVARGAAA